VSDLAVTGGLLVDGTGAPARRGDLLISGGRIADIVPPGSPLAAPRRIGATGRVVCPGFIDLHSHGDLVLALDDEGLRRRLLHGRIAQGITTEVVGNCGLGPAPLHLEHADELRGVLAWMTPSEQAWPWRGVGEYLDRIEALGPPVNVATLVAHGALRIAEAGLARALPSQEALKRMEGALEKALDEGAFGMSLGLIYPPGSFTPTEEIEPLAAALSRRGGILTAHVRGSSETLLDAVGEILGFGRRTGVPIHHSHSEAVGPGHWSKIPLVLELESAARREGVRVTFDMFPYTAAATSMAAIYPPWALEGGLGSLVARLRDPALRARIRLDVARAAPVWPPWEEGGWAHNLVRAVGWERITVGTVASESNRWAEGKDLASVARERGGDPFDAISDLMAAEEGRVSQIIHGISGDDGDESRLVTLLADPHGAVCTDANDTGRGRPHPAAYGTYPKVLGTYVREKRALPLEEAIRKMTSYPASILGLSDRGILRRGAAADVVVFDPLSVGSGSTYQDPRRIASGIDAVIVNGDIVVDAGRLTGVNPGVVLRRVAGR